MCTHRLSRLYPPEPPAEADVHNGTLESVTWVLLNDSPAVRIPESLQERTGCHCPECGAWCLSPATRGL